jgi:hypothetical protein
VVLPPHATPTSTLSPSVGPSTFHLTAIKGGGGQDQKTQYRVRLYHDSTTAQSGLKARIVLNLSEITATGVPIQEIVSDKYWE